MLERRDELPSDQSELCADDEMILHKYKEGKILIGLKETDHAAAFMSCYMLHTGSLGCLSIHMTINHISYVYFH